MKREKEVEGKGRVKVVILMIMVMMVVMMGCNSGGVGEGKVDLAKKNSFLESLVKIGEGFQEIFAGFGSAIGDIFGFNIVKVGDNRSKVGEHFENLGKGLQVTKDKLNGLAKEITSAPHVDTRGVESVINSASEVIAKLVTSVNKLAGGVGNTDIGDNAVGAAVAADKASVETVIEGVKSIIETATGSGIKIEAGTAGNEVAAGANTDAPAVIAANAAAGAGAGAGSKLADEITKADSWAMIDKIKNAKTKIGNLDA
ncbi:Variable major protein, partial (plasmid) [Borrelia crocidurae DOU]